MKKAITTIINNIEAKAVRSYGFESKLTIITFTITERVSKLLRAA